MYRWIVIIVAVVAMVAALLVVPEVRKFLGLNDTQETKSLLAKISITIDEKSLHFIKSMPPHIFSGTVHPSSLCQKVRVSVKTEGGYLCFNREPICNNETWKVECTDELQYLLPGKYEVTLKAEGIAELVFLEISD